jgi:hypothetical protein
VPENITGLDGVATVDLRIDRLVRRSLSTMVDRDDADTSHRSGERDVSWRHGPHGLANASGQVDATVTRAVLGVGKVESGIDAVLVLGIVERPGPRTVSAPGRCRNAPEDEKRHGNGTGEKHVLIPRSGRDGRQGTITALGRSVLLRRIVDFVPHDPVP